MNIRRNLKLILFFLLVFIKTENVNAENYKIFYFLDNDNLSSKEYYFAGNFNIEEKVYFLIENILNNKENMVNYIPEQLKLLNLKLEKKNLVLNFSKEIQNYGGTHFELQFIKQILLNCFQFENIDTVTFLTQGSLKFLPEGSIVYKYSRDFLGETTNEDRQKI